MIERDIAATFHDFVTDPAFSCLAGKGVVRAGGHTLRVYGELGSERSSRRLSRDLAEFVASPPAHAALRAFVAVFPRRVPDDENEFERRLWTQLERLNALDDPATGWDPTVSSDPDDPHFAFSFAGRAMFVIGLHSASSRIARRFAWPTLVFNPRDQFEMLRADGRFERLRAMVRDREVALQGSLNPNLADFGEQSEARQYSGRAEEPEWRCPFHPVVR